MKNRFLPFLRKYWVCFLLSILMVVGMSLSERYDDLYVLGEGMIQFGLWAIYVIYVVPVYSILYGIVTNICCKKIWVPNGIYLSVIVLLWCVPLFLGAGRFDFGSFLLACIPVCISMVFSLLTVYFRHLFSEIKKEWGRK